ncbi:MAG: hypothetical protein ABSF44_08660 [Candidatus Bathyarchaeia archaeon]
MSIDNRTPPIVIGFAEGLLAPIFELVISILVASAIAINSATGSPNLTWVISLFFLMDFARNVISCLLHTQYAIGHVAGSIFGIILFYGAISFVSREVANSSLLITIILIVSLFVGVCIAVWQGIRNNRNSETRYYQLMTGY